MLVRSWRLGGAMVAGAVALTACNGGAESQAMPRDYSEVEIRDIEVRVEATGNIEPIRIVEVKSKASGEVTAVHVESGDYVERGTLLVEIDPRDVNTAYEQSAADMEVTAARFKISKSQLENTRRLYVQGVVTQQELQSAELSVANDSASFIRALTNLELAEQRKNDVRISAPSAGTVIARTVEPGLVIASASNSVSGGSVLLMMADLSQMQVRSLIDETDLGQVKVGMPVTVTVDAYRGRDFVGQVQKIEPQAVNEQNVTMFPIIVVLDNPENLLRPGMNVNVEIEVAERSDVVAVSSAAVVEERTAAAAGVLLGLTEDQVEAALNANPETAPAVPAEQPSAECVALRAKVQESGVEALTEEERGQLQACPESQPQMANAGRRGGGRAGRGGRGRGGRGRGGAQAGQGDESRGAVVFVTKAGVITPRRVMLGVNDWEFAEVRSGLQPGDSVVLISVAQLQEAQQNWNNRMRDRMGGFPGSDSRGGGGRRGRN